MSSAPCLAQMIDNFGEKFDVSAVVTGNTDRAHVFLDGGANNIADRSMITKINDLDAVPDEFQVDRVDGAIVSIADRDSGQNADRCSHWKNLALNR